MNAPKSASKRASYFITFEGGEGVGKSTQISRLAKHLENAGLPVTISREPGGTEGAEAVRHVVLDKAAAEPFGPKMEALLFAAARSDHVEQVIKPALEKGDVVIVDRFIDSTRVYQGSSNQLDDGFVRSLERVAINGELPNLTIILNLDPALGMERAASRRADGVDVDRFEREELSKHEARQKAFLKIAEEEPHRCIVIDASGDMDAVDSAIWKAVSSRLVEAKILTQMPQESSSKPAA